MTGNFFDKWYHKPIILLIMCIMLAWRGIKWPFKKLVMMFKGGN